MNHNAVQTIAACFRDTRGRLIIRDTQGRQYSDVRLVRMFPITDPERWISVCDSQGSELLCIENLDSVPAEARHVIQEELDRCMFTPVIRQITRSVHSGPNVRLSVVTDRGTTDIAINAENVYRLSGNRILIKDLNGIRYLIPDWQKMSPHSRKILDMYL